MKSAGQQETLLKRRELDIEEIMGEIRPFGLYQLILAGVYSFVESVSIGNNGFMTYGGIRPKWSCNGSAFSEDCAVFDGCGNLTYKADFYSIIPYWDLVCDQAYYVQLITTLQMIGVFFGAIVSGHVSDHFGRKWTAVAVVSAQILFGSCSVFSPGWKTFAAFRFLIGLTIGGTFAVTWVLSAEFTTNRRRFLFRAIATTPFVFMLSQTAIAYATQHWISYVLISNLQGIPLVISMTFLMESPRWLAQKGRYKEAMLVLHKVAWINCCSDRLEGLTLRMDPGERKEKFFIWNLFRERTLAIYTLATTFLWFTAASTYYGMVFDLGNLGANVYLATLLLGVAGLSELPVAILDNFWARLNRKTLTLASIAVLVLSNVVVGVLQIHGSSSGTILAVLSIVGLQADNLAFDMAYLYSAELFPTLIRNIANSCGSAGARIGAALAPQIAFAGPPLPSFIFAGIGFLAFLIIYFWLPDTKHAKLPEAFTKEEDEKPMS